MVSDRRLHGRYYTPSAVSDLAISVALGDRWPPRRVLDPSCGDGAFLIAASRRGMVGADLVGRDNDPDAIDAARSQLPGASLERVDLFDPAPSERFDAILGNPPYVRNDRLDADAKQAIERCLRRVLPDVDSGGLVSRGDLAACSLLRAVSLLEPGGRLGFIVSAALLEADYATPLWSALGQLGQVRDIVVAPTERWFAEAAVNTIILVFERGASGPTRISRLTRPTTRCAERVGNASELPFVADVRLDDSGSPRRWAHLLRAPAAWLELEQSPALVPLGDVADVRRGMTTGANDIFYMTRGRAAELLLEADALSPLVRAPPRRGNVPIAIDPEKLENLVLRAPDDLAALPNVARYLEGHADAANRPTMRGRDPWWKLPSRPARLFLAKAYARRFVQRFAPRPLDCDQRVYAVWPRDGVSVELLAAILNGSLTALAIESLGRASMGEGALEWTVADARSLPVLDPRRFDRDAAAAVAAAFEVFARRSIETSEREATQPDRRALDGLLLSIEPRLGASREGLAAVVAEASRQRETRSQRVLVA